MLIYTDENNFEKAIMQKEVCLVDFFATWCGPCRMLNEELIKLDKEQDALIIKVDIDECPNLAEQFNIDVVPTMFVLKNGKPVQKLQGYIKSNHLAEVLKQYE